MVLADVGADTDAHRLRRLVALEGGFNFRDLGGYPTATGRVAWGRVFRAGSLDGLTAADQHHVAGLGLRTIIDLRSNRERRARPTRLVGSRFPVIWCLDHDGSVGDIVAAMSRAGASSAATRAMMTEMYCKLPYELAPAYRELFLRLLADEGPVLFHCAAGKDRTGVAAALLLELLAVPRKFIVSDYLLTGLYFENLLDFLRRDSAGKIFAAIDRSIWEPLLTAEAVYLEAMFQEIEREHGSMECYMSDVLGISLAQCQEIKKIMCD